MAQPAATASAKPQKDLGPATTKPATAAKKKLLEQVRDAPTGVKIGTAIGLGSLLVFGLPALVPVAVGGAAVGGWYAVRRRRWSKCMTPERVKVYQQAITSLKDPKKLRLLADEFERAGCLPEAEHLRKRAALRDRKPEEKKADQARYKRAMADTDVKRIEVDVAYFESIGADGSAKNLRTRIDALKAVKR